MGVVAGKCEGVQRFCRKKGSYMNTATKQLIKFSHLCLCESANFMHIFALHANFCSRQKPGKTEKERPVLLGQSLSAS